MPITEHGTALDGVRIRELRRYQALSQIDLAERASLNKLTIRSAEKGNNVALRSWRKIAEALGVEPSELLVGGE